MSPMQQMLLGVGAVATKTYVDDVFSTYLYTGNQTAGHTITNGIDLANKGGLVWIKGRESAFQHELVDTVRGAGYVLKSDSTGAQGSSTSSELDQFNSDGFRLAYRSAGGNSNNQDYASWSFRKAPGFFDVVTYTGNSSDTQTISHSLGCVPGLIIVKRTNDTGDFAVLHRSLGAGKYLRLNQTSAESDTDQIWNDTEPTSTQFTAGVWVNAENSEYVAYVFAGGESTAATARSVEFDGNNSLSLSSTSDFSFPYDFTVEFWALTDSYSNSPYFCDFRDSGSDTGTTNRIVFYTPANTGKPTFWLNGSARITASNPTTLGTWSHYALVRSGSTTTMYINGIAQGTYSDSTSYGNAPLMIGQRQGSSVTQGFDGKISNFRIFRGVAVYTSSFKPSTTPLTGNALTKLLCCNDSSVTGKTYGGTITANGDPTASTDSPFDDPAGFVFGDAEDQNVIKCGSYVGNGSSTGPEINLGWEPQWLLIKNASTAKSWKLLDSMRGIVTGGMEAEMQADNSNAEHTGADRLDLTSTGFKLNATSPIYNGDGDTYIYCAIRRSDGYVGKPPELGTDVFTMDTGNDSSSVPCFDSTFPVDFGFIRRPATAELWYTGARLMGNEYLRTDDTNAQNESSSLLWDSNKGWWKNFNNTYQSWMWKRHAGFDVVTYKGDGVQGRDIPHSLGVAPEMMWVKNRTRTTGGGAYWNVYVSGITHLSVFGSDPDNFGSNPPSFKLNDTDDANFSGSGNWDHTHPTSTHFTVGDTYSTNQSGEQMIAFLFASSNDADGNPISKVGNYTGTANTQTITLGFQPRMLFLKNVTDDGYYWQMVDTTRGWTSSSNKRMYFNHTRVQDDNYVIGEPLSTGFTITGTNTGWNKNNSKYIYYAHA